jgi:F-type H+-transporting ATPase subunit b
MNRARDDAEAHRKELMEKAREEVDLLQARWVETLKSERDAFLAELRQLAGTQIYSITRQVLKDLADVELEQRIVEILMERIQTMDDEERGKFRDSLAEGGMITVQSAFDIPADERKKLDDVIHRYINGDTQVVFEKSENVMTGYELKTDGHKIAWSIKDYLDSLEEKFYHALYEEAQDKR